MTSGGQSILAAAAFPGGVAFCGAAPWKLLRVRREAGSYRIPLDIPPYALELSVSDQMVIALVLPEPAPRGSENAVCFVGCEALERGPARMGRERRASPACGRDWASLRRRPGGSAETRCLRPDGSSHDTSDFRAAQRKRSGPGGIEKPVHGSKGLSVGGQDIRAKATSAGRLLCSRKVTNMGTPVTEK